MEQSNAFKAPCFADMFIYKLHVRGFTAHSSSGVKNKGTYAGVIEKIPYLTDLGVNAVLMMPCYDFEEVMHQDHRADRNNFWGYGAKSDYFEPKKSFASDRENYREEFRKMVDSLHEAGIAVLMEMDFSVDTPDIKMLEALRFWKNEYHIDGFRLIGNYALKRLFATDPELAGVILIAENWDNESIRFGNIANTVLAECNDSFMISVRRFIKGDEGQVREFADLMCRNGIRTANINYLGDHDGFTLNDVFSYDVRHNEANGENNLDGREINYSWNCGAEGKTNKRNVLKLRLRMIKNALSALFLSQGTPMILAGDEFGCTHKGNNNPYCCDNELSWVVWEKSAKAKELSAFTKTLVDLRRGHRVFSNTAALLGTDYIYNGSPDVSFHGIRAWYPDYGYYSRTIGIMLNGEYAALDQDNKDNTYYLAFNMHWEEHEFDLPGNKADYVRVLSTDPDNSISDRRTCVIKPRSIAVFEMQGKDNRK